jgi:hypothetical protein
MQYLVMDDCLSIGKARDSMPRCFSTAMFLSVCLLLATGITGRGQESRDPLLDLMIQKGMLTQDEAQKVKAEADALHTNALNEAMPPIASKWKISKALKDVELFGDVRVRYEHRQAETPLQDNFKLDRGRLALRFGLRGDLFDDFYFGFRLETSTNPRSPWITMGDTSPFGKSGLGVNVGQAYLGWRCDWLDLTAGKMPNPLYSTPMVWDPDLNLEGAAERIKYTIGNADFFVNMGQFIYQDNLPSYVSGSLLQPLYGTSRGERASDSTFLLAWQAGVNYRFTESVSAKVAATLYQYLGLATNASYNGIGDAYIGEGAYGGPGSSTVEGLTYPTGQSVGAYNQVGVNHLLVVDVPFEVNFKIRKLNVRVFGDYAYNLEGNQRATDAVNALALQNLNGTPPLLGYGAQTDDVKAYQIGLAVGNGDGLGLATGSVAKKHTWEFRSYWQHVEQYALDPNLLDSDVFEGRGNLEGICFALAYGFTDNMIGTFRYGYASRINKKLGTGGSNLDIPQINPIQQYQLFQFDMTLKF